MMMNHLNIRTKQINTIMPSSLATEKMTSKKQIPPKMITENVYQENCPMFSFKRSKKFFYSNDDGEEEVRTSLPLSSYISCDELNNSIQNQIIRRTSNNKTIDPTRQQHRFHLTRHVSRNEMDFASKIVKSSNMYGNRRSVKTSMTCFVVNIRILLSFMILAFAIFFDHGVMSHPLMMNNQQRQTDTEKQLPVGPNVELRLLNQLRHSHLPMHSHRGSQSHLTDPIFDPSFEELSLESNEPHPMMTPKQFDRSNKDDNNKKIVPNDTVVDDDDDDENTVDMDLADDDVDNVLEDDQEDQSVEKIIKSGWIEHTSTKKLLQYLRKIDQVLFQDSTYDSELLYSFENPINPDEQELLNAKTKKASNGEDLMQTNKNLEIIMNRIMNTPNVVKKRGEGPQLSIDYPLTVLRQRLIMELARRKAKETEEQIAINSELLKKLGRRRRRSISDDDHHQNQLSEKKKRSKMIDCDEINCNLNDLNMKRSNLRNVILSNDKNNRKDSNENENARDKQQQYFFTDDYPGDDNDGGGEKTRFRSNDKFFMFDKRRRPYGGANNRNQIDDDADENDGESTGLAYNNMDNYYLLNSVLMEKPSRRINSKKPNKILDIGDEGLYYYGGNGYRRPPPSSMVYYGDIGSYFPSWRNYKRGGNGTPSPFSGYYP